RASRKGRFQWGQTERFVTGGGNVHGCAAVELAQLFLRHRSMELQPGSSELCFRSLVQFLAGFMPRSNNANLRRIIAFKHHGHVLSRIPQTANGYSEIFFLAVGLEE